MTYDYHFDCQSENNLRIELVQFKTHRKQEPLTSNFDFIATNNFTSSHTPWVMFLA